MSEQTKPFWGSHLGAVLAVVALSACANDAAPEEVVEFSWEELLPAHFPIPRVPEDNPMTHEKIELGRRLFYDTLLSGNQTQSCASCHAQDVAFSDPLPQAIGSTGEFHPRGSMSLANVAYANRLTWGNPLMKGLEGQMLVPLFGDAPIELGLPSQEVLLDRLKDHPDYPALFEEAFPAAEEPISTLHLTHAISAFQRRIISVNSPYDQYLVGDSEALTASEKRGMDLFFSETLECFHCHGGFMLADAVTHEGKVFEEAAYHNNGLYNVDGFGMYPTGNAGVFDITGVLEDSGKFKAPTLRNIALTAPYMHDGSLQTLDDVIDHYARGGTLTADGPNAGDGALSRFKSEFVNGFTLTDAERADLLAFLHALTDPTLVTDEALSDPNVSSQ